MTHFVNPTEVEGDLVPYLVDLTKGGADYSFECIGNVADDAPGARMLPSRLGGQRHHRRRRRRPGDLRRGRFSWSPAGCGRAPRSAAPAAAPTCRRSSTGTWKGKINIDDLITHKLPLDQINEGFDLMHAGESIRSVVVY